MNLRKIPGGEDYISNYIRLPFGLSIMCIAQKEKKRCLNVRDLWDSKS